MRDLSLVVPHSQKERFAEFDYLRGVAIALIVLGHSIFLAQPVFPLLLENLLRGGTGLFVFISGFFFHRVFYPRFNYRKFIAKKAKALLIPFLVISLFALFVRMFGWWQDGLDWQQNVLNAWYTLRNGYVLYPHWYIPFIFLTFLCSPLHLAYIRTNFITQTGLLVLFSFIAVLMHRPESNSNFLQSLVYFTPYYLLGILISQYEQSLRRWHVALLIAGLVMVAVTALAQTYLWVHIGNYHTAAFHYAGWDLQFIQTLFGCIAMLALCRHISWLWLQQHLQWLAELSFPIFFIHPLLTILVENIAALEAMKPLFPVASVGNSLLVFIVVFVVQFYGSAGVAVLVRNVFKSKGKFIVG
ncbi:acyltransferase [Cellvibrio mixtus]|uniref:acyltransferase n=1 Tax=Cellvibrio mixtus TaxID=39650 RepID=UPI000694DCCB|nr:acyltransferase [Cellvibrio mixtus]